MNYRIGINGLGRIGRHILRMCQNQENLKVVAVNDINPDINNIAYTLNYDSIYSGYIGEEKFYCDNQYIAIKKKKCKYYSKPHIDQVPWDEESVDLVIDCTGVKDNVKRSKTLLKTSKIKKIIISHSPSEDLVDFTMIIGANHLKYEHENHNLVASSICDATAIAPITKIINDNYKIRSGYVSTLHPWLSYQNLLDGPSSSWSVPGETYHHYALGRSSINNVIPKPTSAMDAVLKVLPEIKNVQIGSFSYRLPTSIVCSADITYITEKNITTDEVVECLKDYEKNQEFPIINCCGDPLVSMDYLASPYSAIVDTRWLDVVDSNLLKVVLWYDNEYGYSLNLLRQVSYILSFLNGESVRSIV